MPSFSRAFLAGLYGGLIEYEAREVIMEFVDYYNRERLHQGIGYLTPEEKYYGLNNDYALRRQKAKEVMKAKRMEFWGKRALSYI